jgi:hypothetical protein
MISCRLLASDLNLAGELSLGQKFNQPGEYLFISQIVIKLSKITTMFAKIKERKRHNPQH